MDFSSPTMLRVRSIGRRLGVFPPLVRAFRKLAGTQYEERFDTSLSDAIRPGDTVWDIGANMGLYTERFAAQVGTTGHVAAFEPSPRNAELLRARFPEGGTVTVFPVALADKPGTATFYVNRSDDGTTDSLVPRVADAIAHNVQIHRGDEYLLQYPPNVIKVDVEGFELEVVRGLREALVSRSLRSIHIEVHFGIASDRGLPNAPKDLSELLRNAGLSVSWVDASHLIGRRVEHV
jgi:FkbM family methyltransferase